DRVAVTIRKDPPRLRTAIRLPPRFQNRGQLVSKRHYSVFARLGRRLFLAVDVCLADIDGRTRQIDRLPLQGSDLARPQARPDADSKNTLGKLNVPIAPAIAILFEVRYHRLDFLFGERFSLFGIDFWCIRNFYRMPRIDCGNDGFIVQVAVYSAETSLSDGT